MADDDDTKIVIKMSCLSLQKKEVPMRPKETQFPLGGWFGALPEGILLITMVMAATVGWVGKAGLWIN